MPYRCWKPWTNKDEQVEPKVTPKSGDSSEKKDELSDEGICE